jgi:RimJ/RimL family protein N-acetyltransferase
MVGGVSLRDVTEDDLQVFFEDQLDPDATHMAAFPARDLETHLAHWRKVLAGESNYTQTILWNGEVAGNVVSWEQDGERDVGYWIGKNYWGKGIATKALALFLEKVKERPLYAHVAKHNFGSMRVLEKCGFEVADDRNIPPGPDGIEEVLLILR